MKAVWSYKKIDDFREQTMRWYLMIASVYSWRKFAPQFTRVLYLDAYTRKMLSAMDNNVLSLWDEIIELDFNTLLTRAGNKYWCGNKGYALVNQTEPFWFLDADVVLHKPIDSWFDSKNYYGWTNISLYRGSFKGAGMEEAFRTRDEVYRLEPGLRQLNCLNRGVNGGCIFYADPKVGVLTGYLLLGIQSKFFTDTEYNIKDKFESLDEFYYHTGDLCEEGVYPAVFDLLGIEVQNLCDSTYRDCFVHYFDKKKDFANYTETRKKLNSILECNIELSYMQPILSNNQESSLV